MNTINWQHNQWILNHCPEIGHDFQPIIEKDGSSSFYVCKGCGGVVGSVDGLRYMLTGSLEDRNEGC